MAAIAYDDFAKVEIRVGRIVQVDDFPKARKPAYQLRIDFGELGLKSSSAQITKYYARPDLVGKRFLPWVNFRRARSRTSPLTCSRWAWYWETATSCWCIPSVRFHSGVGSASPERVVRSTGPRCTPRESSKTPERSSRL